MLTPGRLIRRLRSLLTTRRLDDGLDEELRFHIEMETAKRVQAGMDETTARASVLRDFGGVSRHRDDARDARGVRPIEDLLQDLRVGLRTLAKQRTYAAVAILTLAIGIGATTALWAGLYKVLLQPYPFPDAEQIVTLWQHDTRDPERTTGVAAGNFLDWKARSRTMTHIAAAEPFSFDYIGPEGPEVFRVALVTPDFWPMQGIRPLLGRTFAPDEFQAGRNNVFMISETMFRTRFGSDTGIVGRSFVLDSIPRVLLGIMPKDVMSPFGVDLWAPKIYRPDEPAARTGGYWQVVGRMAPGVTVAQAAAELRGIARQLGEEFPTTNRNTGVTVMSLRDSISGSIRRTLLVLFGAVALVLLIACVNVANLQLAEGIRRQRELAIRTAIGAGRSRLVRQLLTESFLIALIGALAGLGLAHAGIAAIRVFAPEDMWQLADLRLEPVTVGFALMLAAVAAIAVAALPVVAATRIHLAQSLTSSGRGGTSFARRRANRLLVVSEVALALVLLVGTGLLIRSLSVLIQSERGYRTDGVLVTVVQAWSYYRTPPQRAEFVRQAEARLAALPGVESVGMASSLPLNWPIGLERVLVHAEGMSIAPGDQAPSVRTAAVSPGFFRTMNIPVVSGRGFTDQDIATSTPVVIVNRAFARRYFGDANPLGKKARFGFQSQAIDREIVGVVGDVRHEGLHASPEPGMYIPHPQGATGALHLLVQTGGDAAALQRLVKAELAAINGAMPVSEMTTMEALLSRSLKQRRFQLGLLAAFSVTALALSAIGIYGVMSRATSERTHEIGVRMAIGAHSADVRWMVLRTGGELAVFGIVLGVGMALLLTRFMTGMLFGVKPLDPVTYVAAAGVLLAAAFLASWFPAWRASAVDPVVALRND
jgi:putative ABC transport system permease protein